MVAIVRLPTVIGGVHFSSLVKIKNWFMLSWAMTLLICYNKQMTMLKWSRYLMGVREGEKKGTGVGRGCVCVCVWRRRREVGH